MNGGFKVVLFCYFGIYGFCFVGLCVEGKV